MDAIRDGISVRKTGRQLWYTVTCATCGQKFEQLRYNPEHVANYSCETCKRMAKAIDDGALYCVKEARFERATSRFEAQGIDMGDYTSAVATVHQRLHVPGWFSSTEEVMAAIELLKQKVKIIPQQKVGRYHVDFALPDMKMLLEIDGRVFHQDKRIEGIRDGNILLSMGAGWHIARIDTELINKDVTKLLPAITGLKSIQEKRFG